MIIFPTAVIAEVCISISLLSQLCVFRASDKADLWKLTLPRQDVKFMGKTDLFRFSVAEDVALLNEQGLHDRPYPRATAHGPGNRKTLYAILKALRRLVLITQGSVT